MSIYLDNAATSFPKPESVYQAVDRCLRQDGAAFGRGAHAGSDRVRGIVDDARRAVSKLIDAESYKHLVFTLNCTDSLNIVLQGLLNSGDRVITTVLEHNSVLRPLHQLRQDRNIQVVTVGIDARTGLLDLDELRDELAEAPTALVAVTHASNVTGVIQPVRQIVELTHKAGGLVLLDAAQTAGHLPFSMQELDVDFLAAAGHKGLMGPLGTGILAIRPGLETRLRPFRLGGTGTNSELPQQPETMPQRFESGNLNVPGIAGLQAGVDWLLQKSVAEVAHHTSTLYPILFNGLSQLENVRCVSAAPSDNRQDSAIGIVSIVVDGMDSRDVGMILDQSFQIECRTGLHCAPLIHKPLDTESLGGTVRFSLGPFNTPDHVATALEAMKQITAAAL